MSSTKPSRARRARGALKPTNAAAMPFAEYLRASLIQLETAIVAASEAGSWQAVSTLKLRALDCRLRLDEEIAKAASPDGSMSDEQLLSIIVAAVAAMPPQHLERIEDAVELRRSGKVVRMSSAPA
jgi:hypothetical protein